MKFTNVKKWLAMLLAVCSMLSLVACGKSDKDSAGDDSEKATKVAVVFASSGLGDKSFNDALYDGMKKAESTMGIQWVYSEPKDDAEYEGLISGYADSGDCDLIICLGGSQSSSLENVAPNYPQQKLKLTLSVPKALRLNFKYGNLPAVPQFREETGPYNRAYVLETGNISIEGNAADLLNDPRVKKAYLGQ